LHWHDRPAGVTSMRSETQKVCTKMLRFLSVSIPLFLMLLMLTLADSASSQTEMDQESFVAKCVGGGLGKQQTREACVCGYSFLTSRASQILRKSLFTRVRDGKDAQLSYLNSIIPPDQAESAALFQRLTEETGSLLNECKLEDE